MSNVNICPFDLKNEIGKGSYGAVHKAKHINGKDYAVKIIYDFSTKKYVKEFESMVEVDISCRTKSPYLLKTLMIDTPNCYSKGASYVSELKSPLFSFVKTLWSLNNYHEAIKKIMYNAALGIRDLHSGGFLHLDIKMSNTLTSGSVLNPNAVIIDYGLAEHCEDVSEGIVSSQGKITITYRAPEHMTEYAISDSKPDIDHYKQRYTNKTDIWSLGILFLYIIQKGECIYNYKFDSYNYIKKRCHELFSTHEKCVKTVTDIVKNNYDYEQSTLIDLLTSMLQYSPSKRIDINTVVEHPFFRPFNNSLQKPSSYVQRVYFKPERIGETKILGIAKLISNFKSKYSVPVRVFFLALDIYMRSIIACGPYTNYNEVSDMSAAAELIAYKYYSIESIPSKLLTTTIVSLKDDIIRLLEGVIHPDSIYEICSSSHDLYTIYNYIFLSEERFENINCYLMIDYETMLSRLHEMYIMRISSKDISCAQFFDMDLPALRR